MINSDALIKVRFLTPQEGGRNNDIVGNKYGCPLMINNNEGFDCRFVLNHEEKFILGKTYNIYIRFLNSHHATELLREGMDIFLWEGKIIAVGTIIKLNKH